jgi:hypothetical protein
MIIPDPLFEQADQRRNIDPEYLSRWRRAAAQMTRKRVAIIEILSPLQVGPLTRQLTEQQAGDLSWTIRLSE